MPASSSIFFLNPWLKIAITRPTPITATTVPSPIPIITIGAALTAGHDADQMSLTDQSDCDRDTDVEEVKTVFGKSHTLMYRVCDRLHSFRQVDLGMPPQIPESLPKTDSETL